MATRKRVSVDVLRQILGDSQTDQVLEKLSPAKPTIPIDIQSLKLARTLFSDPLTESKQWPETVPVLRRYFLERGQARRGLLAWLDQAPVGQVDGTGPQTPASRPRRKITDPDLLERRRAALAKAREARRRKLQAGQ